MKIHVYVLALMVTFIGGLNNATFAATPLDTKLEPATEEKSNVFQDMGVVQRKAMKKRGRFLFSSYLSLDFSDGPYTNYSIHINPGYAFSDFFEVYLSLAPAYLVSARSIVDKVANLRPTSGERFSITAAKPKQEFGLEFLWAPLYGKDSFGISSIVRSDTFLKFGLTQVKYDTDSGMSFKFGVGKTFFIGQSLGLRLCVDYDYVQTVIDNIKSFNGQLLTELGLTFYL